MANKSEKAAAAIEALFKKKPGATTDDFLEVAVAADPSLKGIPKRSFNATYLLPMKRAAGTFGTKKRGTRKKAKAKTKTKTKGRAGRGRKKATRKKATRATRRAASAGGGKVSPGARERMRELILERDRQVLNTLGKQGDAKAAYELGAHLDAYIDELAGAIASR